MVSNNHNNDNALIIVWFYDDILQYPLLPKPQENGFVLKLSVRETFEEVISNLTLFSCCITKCLVQPVLRGDI